MSRASSDGHRLQKNTTSLESGAPNFRGEQNLLYIQQKQTIFLNQKAGADDFTVFLVAAALMIQLVIAALMV